jgi:hypothetical protein
VQHLNCPNCSSEFVKRARRTKPHERLFSVFYVYPFRCQVCSHAFKLFQPGIRYIRVDDDRREQTRVSVECPAWMKKDIIKCAGTVVDLSASGCTMRTLSAPPIGSIVTVGLEILDEPKPVTIEAAIVRNANQDRVGLEFLKFYGDERHRLRRVIEGLMSREAAAAAAMPQSRLDPSGAAAGK